MRKRFGGEVTAIRGRRRGALLAGVAVAVVTAAGVASACSPVDVAPIDPVTLTWWHSDPEDSVVEFWAEVAAEYERANPHVTVTISSRPGLVHPRQETIDEPPDLFPLAGAELVEQVLAGAVMDITDEVAAEAELIGGPAAGWNVDGRQFGLPYSREVEGFWYRKSVFAQAGIASPPRTLAELSDVVAKLRAAGIVPIVVHAENGWPAVHYWQNLALRTCAPEVLRRSVVDLRFVDPCFDRAGVELAAFVATDPFQPGWANPAQLGETVTALVVRGQAAMELTGHWFPTELAFVAQELGADAETVLADLGWFPFPSVPGGQGDPSAVLGGGKGFVCSAQAPPECVGLLRYIVSPSVQTRYASLGVGLPAVGDAAAGSPDPYPEDLLSAVYGADHVQVWLDLAYPAPVATAMTEGVLGFLRGFGSAPDIPDAMESAGQPVR